MKVSFCRVLKESEKQLLELFFWGKSSDLLLFSNPRLSPRFVPISCNFRRLHSLHHFLRIDRNHARVAIHLELHLGHGKRFTRNEVKPFECD
jgi:hypothetical protein